MQINRSNLAMDGMAIMEPLPHFDWYCRVLLMLSRYLLRQLPSTFDIEVDANAFLQSMSFVDNGERIPASSWDMAPSAPVHKSPDADATGT